MQFLANSSNTSFLHLFSSLQISLIAHLLTAFHERTFSLISNSIGINVSAGISVSISITSRLKASLPSSLHHEAYSLHRRACCSYGSST